MEVHPFVSQIEHLPNIGIWYFPCFSQCIYISIQEGASEIVNQESELFSARAERYATSNYCSLSLSLSLSFHLHHKTRENWIWGQLQCFCSKRLTESRLGSPGHICFTFDFFWRLLSAQNMNGLVCWCFCFLHNHHLSLLPWQQRQSGEDLVRGNTSGAILATPGTNTSTCVKTTQLWETQHSEDILMIDKQMYNIV